MTPRTLLFTLLAIVGLSGRAPALAYHWTNLPISSPQGSVGAIAFAPCRPSTVYAASGGGFFASSDSGATWALRSEMVPGRDLTLDPSVPAPALAVDPTDADVVWAAFGPLSKSADGGASWTTVHVGLDFPVYAIALDPSAPATHLYVGTSVGLYKTRDGGTTWALATSGIAPLTNFFAVEIAPSDHRVLYAGSAYGPPRAGLYKSIDAGATWITENTGVAVPDTRAIAVDPRDANVVYRSDAVVGISRTTDGGAHWVLSLAARGIVTFALDPAAPDTLYAGSA